MNSVVGKKTGLLSFCLFLGLAGCGSGTGTGTGRGISTDPSVTATTASVALQVGSTNEIFLNDSLTFETSLADDIETTVDANIGTTGNDNHFLVDGEPLDSADSNAKNIDEDVEITKSAQTCDSGGTKQLAGTLHLNVLYDSDQGTLSGTYSVIYSDCVELVLLTTSNGTCVVTTQISGTMTNVINIEFSQLDLFNPDRYDINNTVTSNGPITFAINNGASQEVTYDYDVYDNSLAQNPSVDGKLTFGLSAFDPVAVSDFITTSTTSSVCP